MAEAARTLGLKHVVITCVTRDDLPDGGAEHFVRTVDAARQATGATVEVLPSDFAGNAAAVDRLIDAAPEVYNHNTETVPRLFPTVRKKGVRTIFTENSSDTFFPDYAWTLEMFRRIRRGNPARAETRPDARAGRNDGRVADTLADLLRPAAAC